MHTDMHIRGRGIRKGPVANNSFLGVRGRLQVYLHHAVQQIHVQSPATAIPSQQDRHSSVEVAAVDVSWSRRVATSSVLIPAAMDGAADYRALGESCPGLDSPDARGCWG